MTNRERADKLLEEGKEILDELDGLLGRRSWNLAVRRSQEVVELTLKALLAEMSVDYPKIHDVAPHFIRVIRARGLNLPAEALERLEEISAKLAVRRAPAFYFEATYGEAEARQAVSDAEEVMGFGSRLLEQIRR